MYTRLGDTNIPLNESAQESQIELMWRERFGIGLSPLEKIKILLQKPDEWVRVDDDRQIYHKQCPEFTIREGAIKKEDFEETWTEKFFKITAQSFEVELRFFETILAKRIFVRCDGNRFQIPLPEIDQKTGEYYILADSIEYNIAQIFWQYYPINYALSTASIKIRFENFSMDVKLIAKAKEIYDDGSIVEIVIWELPDPIPPSTHKYKYRLYYGRKGSCFVRYDNERGKGDHKHINSIEINYSFRSISQLLDDFEKDIENWSKP